MTTETTRVEAFSDGVFAIAITLLILELKVPAPGTGDLSTQLLRQWPSYLSYAISFAFIGIMWVNHHRLFTHIKRCDDTLLILNLLLLFGVTTVPFPTAVLAAHLKYSGARTAALFYNGCYLCLGVFFNVLWRYASSAKRNLLTNDFDRMAVQRITRAYAFGPLLYLVCTVVAWFSVTASLVINAGLAVFFVYPHALGMRELRSRQPG